MSWLRWSGQARLAENPEHPELHDEALAELRCVLDTLWLDDDEAIELAIRDLTSLVHGGDRLAALRALGIDEQSLCDLRCEARDMLAYLRDDDDPEPRLALVKP